MCGILYQTTCGLFVNKEVQKYSIENRNLVNLQNISRFIISFIPMMFHQFFAYTQGGQKSGATTLENPHFLLASSKHLNLFL